VTRHRSLRAPARCWLVLSCALFLCGCEQQPRLNPLANNGKLLAFGDSLTAGVGAGPDYSYPAVLAELTGLTVVNAGVSGETTDEGRRRLAAVLEKTQPSLLILIEGGNDILQNSSPDQTRANLAAMIELARREEVQVVLLGIPEKRLFSDSAPFYKELAEAYGLPFDGELMGRLLREPSLKSDPIHLNRQGYREMAAGIYKVLQARGAFD
jgi:lysophospholipase L1-like esterase